MLAFPQIWTLRGEMPHLILSVHLSRPRARPFVRPRLSFHASVVDAFREVSQRWPFHSVKDQDHVIIAGIGSRLRECNCRRRPFHAQHNRDNLPRTGFFRRDRLRADQLEGFVRYAFCDCDYTEYAQRRDTPCCAMCASVLVSREISQNDALLHLYVIRRARSRMSTAFVTSDRDVAIVYPLVCCFWA